MRVIAYQIISKKQDALVTSRYGEHHHCTNGCKSSGKDNDQPFRLKSSCQPSSSNNSNYLDRTKGEIEQNGLEARVAERFDDEVSETANSATRDSVKFH